jgi:hypothetical protein
MADLTRMRLGRKAIKTDTRTLALADYITPKLPAPPPAKDWTRGITDWGMMMNGPDPDNPPSAPHGLGDCTIAGCAHAIQVWSANLGSEITVPDPTILSYYEQWDSYNPADPTTDSGGIELDVLTNWRQQGFDGHALLAFASPSHSNLTEIRQSIALFGGIYIGLALPATALKQDVWDVVPGSGHNGAKNSWGGHCVFVPAYDEHGFTCITWGAPKKMTVAFWKKYCDEAYALLGQPWLDDKGSPAGFDRIQLMADLKAIK